MDATESMVRHYRALLGERLVGLVAYGSRARGDARPDSDFDVFLLADGLPHDRFDRAVSLPLPPLDPRVDPPVSLRALTPQEFDADISPLDLDIALDGRVLYDRDGSTASRLALIRQRIDEATLYRSPDLVWHWRRPPTLANWAVRWDGVRV